MNTPTTPANITQTSALAVSSTQEFWTAHQIAALRQIGVQEASNGDLAVFLNFAQRTGLDPFARQIYMIGRKQKAGDKWITKWTIQASIDGLRIVAERSGDYAGQIGPEFCGPDGQWRDTWTAAEPPVAARVGVLRRGFSAPLFAVAYYDEYVQTDRDGRPTSMWASKPRLMLAKCAEALALRKAFPNDLAGLYTADEMPAVEKHHETWQPEEQAQELPQAAQEPEDAVIEVTAEEEPPFPPITPAQKKALAAMLTKLGVRDSDERHQVISKALGFQVQHVDELTKRIASEAIEKLKVLADAEDPAGAFKDWLA